jgi:hypothetical protein
VISLMETLYKFEGDKVSYWEAWEAEGQIIIHWGELGDRGESHTLAMKQGQSAKKFIAQEAKKYRAEGYRKLKEDEEVTVLVQYQVDGWGTPEDLDKRHAVEDRLNECLGWTGNGRCDGGDIGSGTMNVCSLVVNPYLAGQTIVEELRKNNMLEGAVIAIEREDSFEVLYPGDYGKEFSYWY